MSLVELGGGMWVVESDLKTDSLKERLGERTDELQSDCLEKGRNEALNECLGLHEHTLDNKGRVIMPACFRALLSMGFTVAMNGDWTSLAIYPKQKWRRIFESLSKIRETDVSGMKYKRLILSNSQPIDALDAQGRFILNRSLRMRAGITSQSNRVVIIGMGDYLEIWDETKFNERENESIGEMNELVSYVDSISTSVVNRSILGNLVQS